MTRFGPRIEPKPTQRRSDVLTVMPQTRVLMSLIESQFFNRYGHGRGTEHGGFSEYSIVKEKYCYKLQYETTTPLEVT